MHDRMRQVVRLLQINFIIRLSNQVGDRDIWMLEWQSIEVDSNDATIFEQQFAPVYASHTAWRNEWVVFDYSRVAESDEAEALCCDEHSDDDRHR